MIESPSLSLVPPVRGWPSLHTSDDVAALRPRLTRPLGDEFDLAALAGRLCPVLFEDGRTALFALADYVGGDQADEVERMLRRRGYLPASPARYVVSSALLLDVARGQTGASAAPAAQGVRLQRSALASMFAEFVRWGVRAGASDLHINVDQRGGHSQVRYTINGAYVAPARFEGIAAATLLEVLAVAWMDVRGGNGPVFDPRIEQQGRIAPLYGDPLAPSLAEMRDQGLLPAGFPDAAPGGLQAAIRLHRAPQCPGDACRIDALVYATAPLRDGRGEPDMMRLAVLNEATAGQGGHATAGPAGRLLGPAFDFPNPITPGAPALPAGTPVLWAGLDADTAGRYVRRFDTRDPQLEAPLSAAGPVSAGGRLRTGEYLELGGTADAGQSCGAAPGLVARDRQGGGLLLCQNGTWQGQDGGFGGAYAYNHRHGCFHYNGYSTANPRTGRCSCPAGYSAVVVSSGGIWSAIEGWTTGYVCVR